MEVSEEFIAELKRLSNLDYCGSAKEMQEALETINDKLNNEFPDIEEN
jgi:hypothetical protein